jgi:hypothetical protein
MEFPLNFHGQMKPRGGAEGGAEVVNGFDFGIFIIF